VRFLRANWRVATDASLVDDVQKIGVFGAVIRASLVATLACSVPHGTGLSCGPGTSLLANECVASDASIVDSVARDTESIDAPATPSNEAIGFAIDPAHDNSQPTTSVVSPLASLWSAAFDGHVSYPLVVGGLVIVSAGGSQPTVRALDVGTGVLVWGPIAFDEPAVTLAYDRGQVFVLDQTGNVTTLDATTGGASWVKSIPNVTIYDQPLSASNGLVYVNASGETFALEEGSGAVAWVNDLGEGAEGSVAVGNGVVYEAAGCNVVAAWDAQTGKTLWSLPGDCIGGNSDTPATYDGLIWDRDASSGNLILNGSGEIVRTFRSDTMPALAGGTAFYESSGTVSAIDISTDTIRWSFTGDGQLCTAPVVAGGSGQVLVGSKTGNVYELDAATGTQRSVANIGTPITCFTQSDSMALAENHLVVPAGNGLVVF
jgi:outer membrane protein assembly factor BamB